MSSSSATDVVLVLFTGDRGLREATAYGVRSTGQRSVREYTANEKNHIGMVVMVDMVDMVMIASGRKARHSDILTLHVNK